MAQVVVVGGGYGGMATAARLAKLGHDVTVLERSARLGGALEQVSADGFAWEAGPHATVLPAVVRDLFRKSGRSLEAELGQGSRSEPEEGPGSELVPLEVIREHRFLDRTAVRVPGGSRAAQLAAFDALEPGAGQAWVDHVASYTSVWETLRRGYLEVAWDPATAPREVQALLGSRESLRRRLRRTLRDERLQLVAAYPMAAAGHDPRDVPAWAGLDVYLEQRFGAWRLPGGMHRLAELLTARLATRRVRVVLESRVRDIVVEGGRAVGVSTDLGPVAADVVVCAIDPRLLPTLQPLVQRTVPALPPMICHLGVEGTAEELAAALGGPAGEAGLAAETVLHDAATLSLITGGSAPPGCTALTVHGRGRLSEDVLTALARHGLDLRDRVVTRVDRGARSLVEHWHGTPYGVVWQGRGTVRHRLGPRTPVPGVFAAGAHATPGGGLPWVGLSAAQVAECVGPA